MLFKQSTTTSTDSPIKLDKKQQFREFSFVLSKRDSKTYKFGNSFRRFVCILLCLQPQQHIACPSVCIYIEDMKRLSQKVTTAFKLRPTLGKEKTS